MPQPKDSSRSLVALELDATLIAVIEMGQASWLVDGLVPGITPVAEEAYDRSARATAASASLAEEAVKAGRTIKCIVVAFEAGRDGFWLARWLRAHEIEAHVIQPIECPRFA